MTKTLVSIKLDPKIKQKAQRVAEEMGLTLSAVINAQLHEFVRTKELHIGGGSRPTPYLERLLEEAGRDIQNGEDPSPVFDNSKDAVAYLKRQMKQ
jgi:addiction module RelB/DinJ family antitoxin